MRKKARENAFKLIFERLFDDAENSPGYEELLADTDDEDKPYFLEVVGGVRRERAFLTEILGRYSGKFKVDRVYKIDLAILLLAAYEILEMDDIPVKVSVNEAVELCKTYSTDSSPSFVNGVLAAVIRDKEEILNERDKD